MMCLKRGTDSAQGQPTSSGAAKADESGPSLSSAPSTVPTVLSVTSAVPGPSLSSAPSTVPTVPSVSHTTSAVPGPSSLVIEIDVSSSASSLEQGSAAPPVDPAECPCFLSDSERTEQVLRGPLPIKDTFTFPKRHMAVIEGPKIKFCLGPHGGCVLLTLH
ncbi:uncharacterized protein LOC127365372 isoform X3 [Dicentrarchus labrax]|uniref:uncharacterized protein LOC127365372 isoform X3 n=1 Tax=Dicentrarchus labrax TaxID=13489 RepID=UPI0021F549BA|nr:uncharacterized protein LOC127365372 isoform X3 [Dicentrarchus labrax]